jgi:hypothetical protein
MNKENIFKIILKRLKLTLQSRPLEERKQYSQQFGSL